MFSEGGAERQAELPPGEAQEFHQQGRQVGLGASSGDRWTVAKELLAGWSYWKRTESELRVLREMGKVGMRGWTKNEVE